MYTYQVQKNEVKLSLVQMIIMSIKTNKNFGV